MYILAANITHENNIKIAAIIFLSSIWSKMGGENSFQFTIIAVDKREFE